MYRYQRTDDVPNWICFGTTENCGADETDSDSNNIPDGIDKYMYRIIGITEEGQMYLIKETFLKDGETTNNFAWNSKYNISECLGEECEWPNVDLYKRLNGKSNGEIPGTGENDGANTDIFVDSSEYDYLKSGDKNNGGEEASEWYQLIADHYWMYGDTNTTDDSIIYDGDTMYAIETGGAATTRYWPDEEQEQTTCSSSSPCTEKPYTWSKSTEATKIGLMYMHDIDYAYTGGNPGSSTNVRTSWIHFTKDYPSQVGYEWLTTRYGVNRSSGPFIDPKYLFFLGSFGDQYAGFHCHVRPVFYLSSNVKIKEGTDGTKENPFILNVQK